MLRIYKKNLINLNNESEKNNLNFLDIARMSSRITLNSTEGYLNIKY